MQFAPPARLRFIYVRLRCLYLTAHSSRTLHLGLGCIHATFGLFTRTPFAVTHTHTTHVYTAFRFYVHTDRCTHRGSVHGSCAGSATVTYAHTHVRHCYHHGYGSPHTFNVTGSHFYTHYALCNRGYRLRGYCGSRFILVGSLHGCGPAQLCPGLFGSYHVVTHCALRTAAFATWFTGSVAVAVRFAVRAFCVARFLVARLRDLLRFFCRGLPLRTLVCYVRAVLPVPAGSVQSGSASYPVLWIGSAVLPYVLVSSIRTRGSLLYTRLGLRFH